MSETITRTIEHNSITDKLKKAGAGILAAAVVGVPIGVALKKVEANPFKTDIPVPTMNQPHISYPVKAGDTEGGIAAKFGHANDLNYENMINQQLPAQDQPNRTLQIGEQLILPK